MKNEERKMKNERGGSMNSEDRKLIVETLAEMRELKGEMREFKVNVMERVEKLERKEGERSRERLTVMIYKELINNYV